MKDHIENECTELVGESITVMGDIVEATRTIEFTAVFSSQKEAHEYLHRNRKGIYRSSNLEVNIAKD